MSSANHTVNANGEMAGSSSSSASSTQPINGKPSSSHPSKGVGNGCQRKRVLIVGAGCAGMSAAYSLSLSPDEFDVVVYDKAPTAGGSATSYQLPDPDYYGADYINDGVQGASPVFYNTFKMFEEVLGFKSTEVGLQISFGKGKGEFWSNVFPSELVDRFSDDIKKFGRTLQTIKRFEPFFAMIPVDRMLKMFRFSPDFGERMLLPLVALFFGTGNETKHVSSAIVERVFLDPSMRLFEFSEDSLLASVPKMMSFPELSRLYGAWRRKVEETGNVRVETSREVFEIHRGTSQAKKKGGFILARSRAVNKEQKSFGSAVESDVREETFDELIMACDADSALKILQAGSGGSWREKKVLGNVKYKWDITVTHNDMKYMKKHYQMEYDAKYNANRDDEESKKAFEFAKENWRPLYLIKMYEKDPSFIEMSFDLTHYQGQFKGNSPVGPDARIKEEDAPPTERKASNNKPTTDAHKDPNHKEPPYDQHVFQTIYLNNDMNDWWTKDEVAKDKIICETWWKQQSHAASHFRGTVPFLWAINGQNHTQYAGAWTLINMHEIGICSAFSAAYAIGGKYPFKDDEDCARLFRLYHALSRLSRMRNEDRKGFFA